MMQILRGPTFGLEILPWIQMCRNVQDSVAASQSPALAVFCGASAVKSCCVAQASRLSLMETALKSSGALPELRFADPERQQNISQGLPPFCGGLSGGNMWKRKLDINHLTNTGGPEWKD